MLIRALRILPVVAAALLLWLAAAPPAAAQDDAASDPAAADASATQADAAVTVGELDRLIATLEDGDARAGLVADLTALRDALVAVAETEAEEDTGLGLGADYVSERFAALSAQMSAFGEAAANLPDAFSRLGDQVGDADWWAEATDWIVALVLVGLAGVGAFLIAGRLLRRVRADLAERGAGGDPVMRTVMLVGRIVVDVVPIIAVVVAASLVLSAVGPPDAARDMTLALVQGVVYILAARIVLKAILAPNTPALRVPDLDDADARAAHRALIRLTTVVFGGYFLVAAMGPLGLPPLVRDALHTLVGLLAAAMLILGVMRMREPVAEMMRGDEAPESWLGNIRRGAAEVWHLFAVVLIVAGFATWALRIEDGFIYLARGLGLTVLILIVARGIGLRIRAYARARIEAARPGPADPVRRYGPLAAGVTRAVLWIAAIGLILEAWGAGVISFLATELGRDILSSSISIAVIIVGAIVVWQLATTAIERRMQATADGTSASMARIKTVLPLLRSAIFIALLAVVVMVILAEIGVNIGPLLAGAGVVGLAVGFGAQALVKDIITGLFILFEDQIQIGNVVDVGGHAGVVEGLTVRTVQLRDLTGTVHIVPWGNVASVKNLTRDFAYYVFDVGVAYREDTDRVVDVLRALAAEFRQDPEFGPYILDDLEVLGLDSFADSAVVIKVRFKTVAGRQWSVGREFNRRMKRRFDEKGIEIPFPHRTIYFGVDERGQAPPVHVTLSAPAIEQQMGGAPAAEPRRAPRRRRRRMTGGYTAGGGEETPESSPGN